MECLYSVYEKGFVLRRGWNLFFSVPGADPTLIQSVLLIYPVRGDVTDDSQYHGDVPVDSQFRGDVPGDSQFRGDVPDDSLFRGDVPDDSQFRD